MARPLRYDDEFISGDSYTKVIKYTSNTGAALSLEGVTATISIKEPKEDPVVEKDLVVSAADSSVIISLTSDDTEELYDTSSCREYTYFLKLTYPDGTTQTDLTGIYTVLEGGE